MKKITFELHDAREELPEKSGWYLTVDSFGIHVIQYSAVFKLFNCFDNCKETLEYAFQALYWAEIPAGFDEVMEEAKMFWDENHNDKENNNEDC